MNIAIGVLTGLISIFACLDTAIGSDGPRHRWGPWVAVAAGLIAMAVAS